MEVENGPNAVNYQINNTILEAIIKYRYLHSKNINDSLETSN